MIDWQRITRQVAERLRDHATEQGNVPVDTGDLRKAHVVEPAGQHNARLSANTPYARAVHDGRPAITIQPKNGKALAWPGARHPVAAVTQPARDGNPWLERAVDQLESDGLDFLAPELGDEVADELTEALRAQGLTVRR